MAVLGIHSARVMGSWVIDVADVEAAHAAIAQCRSEAPRAALEIRHSLWGVQVRTEDDAAARLLMDAICV